MATMPKTQAKLEQHMADCLELCQQCHNVCAGVISYGMQRGDNYLNEIALRLLQDCAEICQTSANFMLRGSEFHGQICAACAEICLKCATACEEFAEDSRLQECAEVCRKCAEACQITVAIATPR